MLYAFLLSSFLALMLVQGARLGWPWIPVDRPNARSLHTHPVPRCGGLAVWISVAVVAGGAALNFSRLVPALVLLIAVSFIDDVRSLPALIRLVVHLVAAAVVTADLDYGPAHIVILMLILAGSANLANFMDGANGLVAGVIFTGCLVLACFIEITGGSSANTLVTVLLQSLCGALLGFLIFNWKRGRLFLGDVGSVPLGFLACFLSLWGVIHECWSLWLPLFVFAPLYADAIVTLMLRLCRRQRIWLPHREHAYQRLVQSGFSHQRVASIYIVMTLCASVLGYIGEHQSSAFRPVAYAVFSGVLCLLYLTVVRHTNVVMPRISTNPSSP